MANSDEDMSTMKSLTARAEQPAVCAKAERQFQTVGLQDAPYMGRASTRRFLTIAIDQHTSMICGFAIETQRGHSRRNEKHSGKGNANA